MFGAWISVFKPSMQNVWSFFITKTTAAIQIKFYSVKYHLLLFVGRPKLHPSIARWQTVAIFKKKLKIAMSQHQFDWFWRSIYHNHMTPFRARICLLGVMLILCPILWVKCPKNLRFEGVNRRFQAKRAKYLNFHAIKTTAVIQTKFCKVINATKCSLWILLKCALQIQNGGRPLSWKKW